MKKGIMAMEDLATDPIEAADPVEPVSDDGDTELVSTELAAERVDTSQDRIDESEALGDVLDTTASQLEASADAEAEPTEELAVAAESFVSYACLRLGVQKPISVSVESIHSSADKRAQLKKAAADIREIRAKLDDGLVLAQEGLIDDFKAFFEVNFKSLEKFKAKLQSALSASNAVEGKASGNFTAGWVDHLGVKGTATGSGVAHIAQQYQKVLSHNGLIAIFNKAENIIKEATKEVRDIWFWSNANEIARLDKLISEIETQVSSLVPGHATHSLGGTEAKVLTKQEAAQLAKVAEDLLKTTDLEQALSKANAASNWNLFWSILNGGLRIKNNLVSIATGFTLGRLGAAAAIRGVNAARLGLLASPSDSEIVKSFRDALNAEDLAKAREVAGHAKRAHGKIYLTLKNRSYLVNAIIKYIEESTKLRAASEK